MTVGETGISATGVAVVVVERKGTVLPFPAADLKLEDDDRLLCYGELGKIRDTRC